VVADHTVPIDGERHVATFGPPRALGIGDASSSIIQSVAQALQVIDQRVERFAETA
jgi:hypothetical protein